MTGTVVGELLTGVQSVRYGAVGLDRRRHVRFVEAEPLGIARPWCSKTSKEGITVRPV